MSIKSMMVQLKKRIFSIKMIVLLVIWIFMMDISLSGFRSSAMTLGEKDVAVVLPFLQNGFYFMKTILLGALCFYSDVPFMQQDEMYYIARMGRGRWGLRNIVVILLNSFLLSLSLFAISVLGILPVARFSGGWGSIYKTFSALPQTMGNNLQINYAIIYKYTPAELTIHIILIDTLAFAFMAMVLYAVSLCASRMAAYAIAVILVFMPSIIGKFPQYNLHGISPFSWMQTIYWRNGNNLNNPDMVYIYTGYLLLIFIFAVLAQNRIRKIDWKALEDNR